jgi:hypothetical protein
MYQLYVRSAIALIADSITVKFYIKNSEILSAK